MPQPIRSFPHVPRRDRLRRAWLRPPGEGRVIRRRREPYARWHFRWTQLRILMLALLLGALAWSQVPVGGGGPEAHARHGADTPGAQ